MPPPFFLSSLENIVRPIAAAFLVFSVVGVVRARQRVKGRHRIAFRGFFFLKEVIFAVSSDKRSQNTKDSRAVALKHYSAQR